MSYYFTPPELENYPGSKGAMGVYQFIINRLAFSPRLLIPFVGSGQIAQRCTFHALRQDGCLQNTQLREVLINDSDPKVCKAWVRNTHQIFTKEGNSDFSYFIERYLVPNETTIYCDPPYLPEVCANGNYHYRDKFAMSDHERLLQLLKSLPAMVAITHPVCPLYSTALGEWHRHEFTYQIRTGPYNDCLWTNYPTGNHKLYRYDYLGDTFTQRQIIKRKLFSLAGKINKLSTQERKYLLQHLAP